MTNEKSGQEGVANNFTSNNLTIANIVNLTNNLSLLTKQTKIEVVGYDSSNITIYAENSNCALGHIVSVDGLIVFNKETYPMKATGKIVELQTIDKVSAKATIRITQFDRILWSAFITYFFNEQERIDKLLSSMGEEN